MEDGANAKTKDQDPKAVMDKKQPQLSWLGVDKPMVDLADRSTEGLVIVYLYPDDTERFFLVGS